MSHCKKNIGTTQQDFFVTVTNEDDKKLRFPDATSEQCLVGVSHLCGKWRLFRSTKSPQQSKKLMLSWAQILLLISPEVKTCAKLFVFEYYITVV